MNPMPEEYMDPLLWHACAGGTFQMPPVHSKVYYFPQGHAENAVESVEFGDLNIPSMILCRVSAIKYMADAETDDVYAKITLLPHNNKGFKCVYDDIDGTGSLMEVDNWKKSSFTKIMTPSDANNGGAFTVPRYCAENFFPKLEYTADPPVQMISTKDIHEVVWKFTHIYRGNPFRHLLTTGWARYVDKKKLVRDDTIVFTKSEDESIGIGFRRFKIGKNEYLKGKVSAESVVEATNRAITGEEFEVVYYPWLSDSEFFMKESRVRTALQVSWRSGMMIKIAFDSRDSARISWFSGTVSSVTIVDPIRWPHSPWRVLEVTWDEPNKLQNRVSPWSVQLMAHVPPFTVPPFSSPNKKMRNAKYPDLNLNNPISLPCLPSDYVGSGSRSPWASYNFPVGLQGARHEQPNVASTSNLHNFSRVSRGLPRNSFQRFGVPPYSHPPTLPNGYSSRDSLKIGVRNDKALRFLTVGNCRKNRENVDDEASCSSAVGNHGQNVEEENDKRKAHIVLFGNVISIEQQNSVNGSADTTNQNGFPSSNDPLKEDHSLGMEQGNCHVESDHRTRILNIRTSDLSALRSYEEFYKMLSDSFGIEISDTPKIVLSHDTTGFFRIAEIEPFSEFLKTTRRITIETDAGKKFEVIIS